MKLKQFFATKSALALLLFAIASGAIAQGLPTARPEAVGMSSTKLQTLKAALQTEVGQGKFPGSVVIIERDGKLVYSEVVGHLDKAAGKPLTKDAMFAFIQ